MEFTPAGQHFSALCRRSSHRPTDGIQQRSNGITPISASVVWAASPIIGFRYATDLIPPALAINELAKALKLKQVEAGRRLGIPQSKVSALVNYRLDGFSVERLIGFLTALDQDVDIMIRPSRTQGEGHVSVLAVR